MTTQETNETKKKRHVRIRTPEQSYNGLNLTRGLSITDENGNEISHVRDVVIRAPLADIVTAEIELFPSHLDVVAEAKLTYVDADRQPLTVSIIDNWIGKLAEVRKQLVENEQSHDGVKASKLEETLTFGLLSYQVNTEDFLPTLPVRLGKDGVTDIEVESQGPVGWFTTQYKYNVTLRVKAEKVNEVSKKMMDFALKRSA